MLSVVTASFEEQEDGTDSRKDILLNGLRHQRELNNNYNKHLDEINDEETKISQLYYIESYLGGDLKNEYHRPPLSALIQNDKVIGNRK